jgi:hypothetical protein
MQSFFAIAEPASYKTVMADEFVRSHILTQYFPVENGVTGAHHNLHSSLAGGDISLWSANACLRYNSAWIKEKCGDFSVGVSINAGGAWYDATATPDIAGAPAERVSGLTGAGNFSTTLLLRPWRHTTLSLIMSMGGAYLENDCRRPAPVVPASALSDGSTRNWFALALTSVTAVSVSQTIPLEDGVWDGPEDTPNGRCLRLSSQYSNINVLGAWGESNDQQRFANAFTWANRAEIIFPFGTSADSGIRGFAAPFIERTDMFDDGNRSLSRERHFYRAGLRAGLFNETESQQKNANGAWRTSPQYWLTGAAYWGKGFDGWQAGVELRF